MRPILRVFAALWLISAPAGAMDLDWLTQRKQPNIHIGHLAIRPYYTFTELYDSNIFFSPRNPAPGSEIASMTSSWITKNDLGFEASMPWLHDKHDLSAGYNFESNTYQKDPGSNNAIDHKAHLDYGYKGPWGLIGKAGDQYENTTERENSELTVRTRRWTNIADGLVEYDEPGGHLTGAAGVSHTMDKYLDPHFASQLNHYVLIANADAGYKVKPMTKVYASYRREIIHYTVHRELPAQDKDNKNHEGVLGVTGDLTDKITGKVEGGMTYRAYDEVPIGGTTKVTRNFTGLADLVYLTSKVTQFELTASRKFVESISDTSRFYIATSALLEARHTIRRRFIVRVSGGYEVDKYPDLQPNSAGALVQRRDENVVAGGRFDYEIQAWLSTGVSYAYRNRVSTLPDLFSFNDQQTAWTFTVKF